MYWILFLDDIRQPTIIYEGGPTIICRNVDHVWKVIDKLGLPSYVSLDHDLGENTPTGYDFVNELERRLFNNEIKIFTDQVFEYNVHSANPAGKKNMEMALKNIKNFINKIQ